MGFDSALLMVSKEFSVGDSSDSHVDMDFGDVKDFNSSIKDATIGKGSQSDVRVAFGKGTCSFTTHLRIGNSNAKSDTNTTVFELHGTKVSGMTELSLNTSGTVSNFVNGASSGFIFSTSLNPTINSLTTAPMGGGINVIFDALPYGACYVSDPSSADFIYWGMAWEGTGVGVKQTDFETLISQGKIDIVNNLGPSYNGKLGYIYETDPRFVQTPTTYYGMYMRYVQPATVIIIK